MASISGPINSGTITANVFEGENSSGKWTVYIQNSGVSYNGNIYPVSIVTVYFESSLWLLKYINRWDICQIRISSITDCSLVCYGVNKRYRSVFLW